MPLQRSKTAISAYAACTAPTALRLHLFSMSNPIPKELTMAIDPVCGMEVDERNSKEKAMHEGTAYYFCSKDCRDEFQASPEDYVGGEEEMTGT
jgi:YHS domain-containing protein